jgi:hypothetical protein
MNFSIRDLEMIFGPRCELGSTHMGTENHFGVMKLSVN